MAKIYLASSWRNELQPGLVRLLREFGHEVYDFRNPPNKTGFAWQQLDAEWKTWTAEQYRESLHKPRAVEGFNSDFDAMKWADTFLLVLPCGRSAHLELGWAVGAGKRTIILTRDGEEPELMAKMVTNICVTIYEVLGVLGDVDAPVALTWTDRRAPAPFPGGDFPEHFSNHKCVGVPAAVRMDWKSIFDAAGVIIIDDHPAKLHGNYLDEYRGAEAVKLVDGARRVIVDGAILKDNLAAVIDPNDDLARPSGWISR